MHSLVDLNKVLKRKGLDPNTPYIGIVIDDNDPEGLGRIRVRLDVFQDSIPDTKLPWCVPDTNVHPNGLKGGNVEQRTGEFRGVPRRGNKVAVYFRHRGDPNNPSYGSVPIDAENTLPEFLINYPYRQGKVLPNGYTLIVDTKTNEVFLHNPGDLNLTILGDVNQTVVGNLQQVITDSEQDIPGYLLNAPETLLGSLQGTPQKKIAFEGLLGGQSGNYHTKVKGHMTLEVDGNMEERVKGFYKRTVKGRVTDTARGTRNISSRGLHNIKGSTINLN